MKLLITLIGLVLIFEGMPYVLFPDAMKEWMKQLSQTRSETLRVFGFVALALGLLICYITQRTDLLE